MKLVLQPALQGFKWEHDMARFSFETSDLVALREVHLKGRSLLSDQVGGCEQWSRKEIVKARARRVIGVLRQIGRLKQHLRCQTGWI